MARLMESTLLNRFEYLVGSFKDSFLFRLNGAILTGAEVYLMLLGFVGCSVPCAAGVGLLRTRASVAPGNGPVLNLGVWL